MSTPTVKTEFQTRKEWIKYLRSIKLAETTGEKVLKRFYSIIDQRWIEYYV